MFDNYCATLPLLLIGFCELVGVSYIYKIERWANMDLSFVVKGIVSNPVWAVGQLLVGTSDIIDASCQTVMRWLHVVCLGFLSSKLCADMFVVS